jgi:glucose-6-phosphate 1-dehydrogenase
MRGKPTIQSEAVIPSKDLQICDIPVEKFKVEPFTVVIFGGTGDLSRKKLLPALFHLYREKELSVGFSILGLARSSLTDEQYRHLVREDIQGLGDHSSEGQAWEEFSRHLFFFSGNFAGDEDYQKLAGKMDQIAIPDAHGHRNVIFYMALPPMATPLIVGQLKNHGLCDGRWHTKIIVEKPFGHDFPSARQLNDILRRSFDECQIYRIDHYLGKETVQDIIFLRFSNSIFEHLWNQLYIDNIQITVAEDLGIENRASFYEQSGVIRDIVQNHMLQLIALVAMEPPIGFAADFIRDEKVKVFRSMRPMDDEAIDRFTVVGQYGRGKIQGKDVPGYRQEKGVASGSNVPTFFAAKFYIASWRWAGVPFYIRTGKRMAKRITEIVIQFHQPPLKLFGRTNDVIEPNVLVLTLQPDEKISLRFGVKYPHAPNQIYTVHMDFSYRETFGTGVYPAYERLLLDCVKGDSTLFVRQDQIEAMWEVVDPIISRWENRPARDLPNYAAGTWGPEEARQLLEQEGCQWVTG